MKPRLLILFVVITLLASACVSQAPASPTATAASPATPQQATANPASPATYPAPGGAYPAAGADQPTAYPPASQPLAPAAPNTLYPDLKEGSTVLWDQAISMIMNNEVTKVAQTHDLQVFLTLKDGRTLVTTEPKVDDIINYLKQCGDPCKDIAVATE